MRYAGYLTLLLLGLTADASLPTEKHFTNSLGMIFIRIAPGEFVMGQGDAPPKSHEEWVDRDADESPAHKVKITRAFYLGALEVTNAQYEQFNPEHKKQRGKHGASNTDDEPVTYVTWQQAADFCQWLTKKEGKPYRLPTEAEWEYACRAGTTTLYSTGDKLTKEQANLGVAGDGKPQKTTAVGSYKPNAWGLHDMHGNVAEWCLDWYGPYEGGEQSDPVGRPDGYARVTRGWSWLVPKKLTAARYSRCANRSGHLPEDANAYTGFRVVLGDLPATKPLPVVQAAYQKNVQQTPPNGGPDPAKPFYLNFVKDGKNPTIPKDSWGPIFSQHNHFAACCVCPNGDVLAVWYTCVDEPGRECAQAASRLRAGSERWEPASFFFGVPDVNCHAPVLLTHEKRIYHFCTQSLHGWDYASDIVRHSDDNGVTWSKPKIMVTRDDHDALSQPCSAIVTKDGVIIVVCDGDLHKDERFIVSRDNGATWKVARGDMRKSASGKYVIHPAIASLKDGSIMAFLRGPQPMPAAITKDLGDTFEMRTTPFPGIGGGQKATALRLASGALLFCSSDAKKLIPGSGGTYAALSLDDGKTWAHARKVESVGGYMAVAQAQNGVIYLCGSRMSCVAFNETWLKEGKPFVESK